MTRSKIYGYLRTLMCTTVLWASAFASAQVRGHCPCDWNSDESVGSQDFFDFLVDFFAGTADYNNDGMTGSQDFFDFLVCFFNPCPPPPPEPDYRGNPNPHEPGETEWAVPGGRSDCAGGVPWARSMIDEWAHGVYPFSGEVVIDAVDMTIPGRGFDFVWARRYRSQVSQDFHMGYGWDTSYNIFAAASGANIVLHNGLWRDDLYTLQTPGVWTNAEFFRQIERIEDGRLEVHFANGGKWVLKALDGSSAQGKIESIIDRNGNAMSFGYDAAGHPISVTDTLGRSTLLIWKGPWLSEVRDFTGRSVRYGYYTNADIGGSLGDLRTVTSPVVTGTPNGNDYPLGKITTYTYSEGLADEYLNHNLVTITDAKGQTWWRAEYSPVIDRLALRFDRTERITWGNASDTVELNATTVTPSVMNNFADIRVILNDRVGNVKEVFYNPQNRGVMTREYTGRADPAVPTTPTTNRPTNKVRATDPDYFETRWEYDAAGLVTRAVFPNLNEIQFDYDDANPIRTANGNMLTRRRLPGPLGGDQAQQVETFTYLAGFGSCCGTNFVQAYNDARGNTVTHLYDASGNRVQTIERVAGVQHNWEYNSFGQMTAHVLPDNGTGHRRRDTYSYYAAGPQTGYPQSATVDATVLALATSYEYNARGAVTARTDPRGSREEFIRNQLDQIVEHRKKPVFTGLVTATIINQFYYDANNNQARVDHSDQINQLGNDLPLPCNLRSTVLDFDILNRVVRRARESVSTCLASTQLTTAGLPPANFLTEEHGYDGNGNRTLTRFGEAVAGTQPANTAGFLWDERDLLFRNVRAAGDAAQSTTQHDYDANGNLTRITSGVEDAATPRVTQHAYDGYNRGTTTTDPMGNVRVYHYDANGNTTSDRADGELNDIDGGAGNVRLSEVTHTYDAMNRRVASSTAHFNSGTQTPIGDGTSNSFIVYNGHAGILSVTNDNNHTTTYVYDTANRLSQTTDARGNTIARAYDANSNVISTTEIELSDTGGASQSFTTTFTYDALDRLRTRTDNSGNTESMFYDGRDNVVRTVDALGRESITVFDMTDRVLRTIRDMDANGASLTAMPGDGNPDIVTAKAWDKSSRLVSQIDDNNNATVYAYDALNRRLGTTFADCTQESRVLDVHGNPVLSMDANGTTVSCQFDRNNRVLQKMVIAGPGVDTATTFESYQHDGLSRVNRAQNDASLVTLGHDSLSLTIRDTINGVSTLFGHDGVGNQTSTTTPGGRITNMTYDALERPDVISEPGLGTIADFAYIGPRRVERRDYGNGTRTAYTYDGVTGVPNPPNDFGVKQIINTRHSVIATNANIDVRTYSWDRAGNKTAARDTRMAGPQFRHLYSYDAADRLVRTQVLNAANQTLRDENYGLDGVSNRTAVTGGLDPGAYTMLGDTCTPPGDQDMNQYTTTSFDARTYDSRGNLTVINLGQPTQRLFMYDYRGRLVQHVSTTGQITRYSYDCIGRRIEKVVDGGGGGQAATTRYYYDGSRICEERDGAGATTATYVAAPDMIWDPTVHVAHQTPDGWSWGILTMRRGGVNYYFHEDEAGSIRVVTNSTGVVAERYEYGDFGRPLNPTTLAAVGTLSAVGNPFGFAYAGGAGRYEGERTRCLSHFDAETGLNRVMGGNVEPRSGRAVGMQMDGQFDVRPDRSQSGLATRSGRAVNIMMDGKLHFSVHDRLAFRATGVYEITTLPTLGVVARTSRPSTTSVYEITTLPTLWRIGDGSPDRLAGLYSTPSGSGSVLNLADLLDPSEYQGIRDDIGEALRGSDVVLPNDLAEIELILSRVEAQIDAFWAGVHDQVGGIAWAAGAAAVGAGLIAFASTDFGSAVLGDVYEYGVAKAKQATGWYCEDADGDGWLNGEDNEPYNPHAHITHESEGGIPMLRSQLLQNRVSSYNRFW